MFHSIQRLNGLAINAADGYLGQVDQFLFDDLSWAIRYLVVDTTHILTKHKKLLSPASFISIGPEGFNVNVSTNQIRNSPDIETDLPISKQKEQDLHNHYGWPYYWNYPAQTSSSGSPLFPAYGAYPYTAPLYADRDYKPVDSLKSRQKSEPEEKGLRSTKELDGYAVMARGGEVGVLIDFLADDELWVLRYSVVNTGGFIPDRKILASHWTKRISFDSRSVYFDIDADLIESGPDYKKDMVISRDFEERLFDYYRKPYYWKR